MVIKRKNLVATMENYVATLIEKLLKKNVAILFCYVATMIKQMAIEFCLNNQICCRVKDFCCDKRKLCHDRKWKSNETSQDKFIATKISMLQ